MGRKYYYLIAGLPDIAMDSTRVPCPRAQFREDYYPQLSQEDQRLVDLLWLEQDNRNLLALLRDRDTAVEQEGVYSADELKEMIRVCRDDDKWDSAYPRYMHDFICDWQAGTLPETMPSDSLAARYYSYAMSTENELVSRWFEMNLDMNNILTALTARKHGLDIASYVVGDNEVADALRRGGSRDFGLADTTDVWNAVQPISEQTNLVERERMIDALRWKWLDDESFFHYFTIEPIFAFLVKESIVERWLTLDADEGAELLRRLINELKDVDVPDEFKSK